jgi:hypothetical protein
MDPTILSAAAALGGSLIGVASTFAASWFTQRRQLRAQVLVQQAVKRETLYAEFVIEAAFRSLRAGALGDVWEYRRRGSATRITSPDDVKRIRSIAE